MLLFHVFKFVCEPEIFAFCLTFLLDSAIMKADVRKNKRN
jgi:hypothetical protein